MLHKGYYIMCFKLDSYMLCTINWRNIWNCNSRKTSIQSSLFSFKNTCRMCLFFSQQYDV